MSNTWHPDEAQLLAYADSELNPEQTGLIGAHMHECEECRNRVDEVRAAYSAAATGLRSALPPPPEPWANLRPRLHDLDVGRVRSRRLLFPRVDIRWAAAAAVLVIGIVAFRLTSEQTVSAAELLQKATAREETTPAKPKRIRVKTRRTEWVRPAVMISRSDEDAATAEMFRSANYNWDEPLSPRSFSTWRSSLRSRDDRVRMLSDIEYGRGRYYQITTSTPDGVLAEASITIRAEDLRAVQEKFEFRNNETVEVSEVVETESAPAPPLVASEPQPEGPQEHRSRSISASDELKVVAALHSIGADLGEPIDIETESERIIVQALATRTERQQQIRTALAGLHFVDLQFQQPEAIRGGVEPRAEATAAQQPSGVQERLADKLGSRVALQNFTEHVMSLSEAALARAHALRALAVRFPPHIEAQFDSADRKILDSIKADHAAGLVASVHALYAAMRPLSSGGGVGGSTHTSSWHGAAESVLAAAQRFDKVATEALAGAPDSVNADMAVRELERAAADLYFRADGLSQTVATSKGRP